MSLLSWIAIDEVEIVTRRVRRVRLLKLARRGLQVSCYNVTLFSTSDGSSSKASGTLQKLLMFEG